MRFKNRSQQAAVMNKYRRQINGQWYWYASQRVKGEKYPKSIYLGKAID